MAQFLFLLYWLLKSFYMSESGGLQIGDYIFVLSFGFLVIERFVLTKKKKILSLNQDSYLIWFIMFVIIINLANRIFYADNNLLLSIAYFIFNFLVIFEFRILAEEKDFLRNFFFTTFFCIFIQAVIYLIGTGRWYSTDRYQGTFNDPNQLAFFVMSRFFILYIIYNHLKAGKIYEKIFLFVAFLLTMLLIVKSASTGMLLGMGVFAAIWLIHTFLSLQATGKVIALIVGVAVFGFFLLVDTFALDIQIAEDLFNRLEGKFNKMSGENAFEGFVKDRNLQAFFNAPHYIMFGSGEGAFDRFISVGSSGNELHSSILALLFYYGIVPFVLLCIWVKDNLKNKTKADICVYLAIFAEMLTLINHRQASLWILFILPAVLAKKASTNIAEPLKGDYK
ncbi:MAG: hypothetical protein IJ506_02995 [Clostridia bacterium]|nr:hypothetical protein [Clostridia bacterium]